MLSDQNFRSSGRVSTPLRCHVSPRIHMPVCRSPRTQRLATAAAHRDEAPAPPEEPTLSASFLAPQEESTAYLASVLALTLQPGDCYCLYGEVGAGKSSFSRAFIRQALQDEEVAVPSPTFLLQNVYDVPQPNNSMSNSSFRHDGDSASVGADNSTSRDNGTNGRSASTLSVHHYDLYRLSGEVWDLERIGIQAALQNAVTLVEWPQRMQEHLPLSRLDVRIQVLHQQRRTVQRRLSPQQLLPHQAQLHTESHAHISSVLDKIDQASGVLKQTDGSLSWPGSKETTGGDGVVNFLSEAAEIDTVATQGHDRSQSSDMKSVEVDDSDAPCSSRGKEDDSLEDFTDQRWRQISLVPHGERWQQRVKAVVDIIQSERAKQQTDGLIIAPV